MEGLSSACGLSSAVASAGDSHDGHGHRRSLLQTTTGGDAQAPDAHGEEHHDEEHPEEDGHDEHSAEHDAEEHADEHADEHTEEGDVMKILRASELESKSVLASGEIDLSRVVATILACQLDPNCYLEGQSLEEEEEEHSTREETQGLKIGLAFAMLLVTLVTSYLPITFRMSRSYEGIMSVLNAVSGAVFLSVAFLHLLPHLLEYEAAVAFDTDFPVGFALVLLGFILILFVESVVFDAHAVAESPAAAAAAAASTANRSGTVSALDAVDVDSDAGSQMGAPRAAMERSSSVNQGLLHVTRSAAVQFRSALITELAVTVHAVLETILLGLAASKSDVLLLFAVIMSHKVFASMSVGTRFTRLGCPASRLWVVMLPYHLLPPLAVILGSIVESADDSAALVLTCLATGTFLYVGAYEVVSEEFGTHSHIADAYKARVPATTEQALEAGEKPLSPAKAGWRPSKRVKFAAYFIAVGVMALITWVLPDPHAH